MSDLVAIWSSLRMELDAHRPGLSPLTEPEASGQPTPVTVLTGFLGAGKSTLLARLLTDPTDGIVVRAVVNDVGSLPFDPTLIAEANRVEIQLTNGCGCCEQTADLVQALDRLALDPTTDLVVLEASGVADPLALAQLVEARPGLRLDRIVAVVDGSAVENQLADPALRPIVTRQLDGAHAVVISNTEDLEHAELRRLVDLIVEAAPGRVVALSTLAAPAVEVLAPGAVCGARPMPSPAGVPHDLPSITVAQRGPLTRSDVEHALARRPAGLVRGKGRLQLDDGFVHVQLTSSATSIMPAEPGECGFTIVATTASAAAALAASLLGP